MIRKIDWLHHTSSRQFMEHLHEIKLIQEPFSEGEILEIQEKFLCNGFQYLKSSSVKQGRSIIYRFLESLAIYNDVSCLTIDGLPLNNGITDLFTDMSAGGYLNPFEASYLDDYFVEQFYFDFVWIEASRQLLASSWFEGVKSKIIDTAIDQHIPILIVAYNDK